MPAAGYTYPYTQFQSGGPSFGLESPRKVQKQQTQADAKDSVHGSYSMLRTVHVYSRSGFFSESELVHASDYRLGLTHAHSRSRGTPGGPISQFRSESLAADLRKSTTRQNSLGTSGKKAAGVGGRVGGILRGMKPHRGDGDEREPTERRRLPRELELELEAESTKGSLLQKFVDLGLCMHVTGATPHFEPTSNFVQLGLLIPETGSLKLETLKVTGTAVNLAEVLRAGGRRHVELARGKNLGTQLLRELDEQFNLVPRRGIFSAGANFETENILERGRVPTAIQAL
ncbi:hypothetical protein C8J57DRAFT_1210293 [Mycena rebaudengoi]|nr:hypothetical protein C8J57DRAFT_1210293 [Mycena rebaudengoi]